MMSSDAPVAPPKAKAPKTQKTKWRSALVLILKCAVAVALLWWLARSGRFDWRSVSGLKPSAALAGVLLFQCAMLGCIAARWHFLARELNLDFSFRRTLRISLIGFYAASWTPASLGLDGARLLLSRRLSPQQGREILASVLWDRVLGLWSLLVVCALSGIALSLSSVLAGSQTAQRAVSIAALACGVLAVVIGVLIGSPQLLKRVSQIPFFEKRAWLQASFPRAIFGWPLLFAFATHGCNILAMFCALRVFEPNAPLVSIFLVTPFVVLSSLVPLTPLGLGVTDATAALLFAAIGVAHGVAATMIARAFFVVISLVCGLAWLWPVSSASEIEV